MANAPLSSTDLLRVTRLINELDRALVQSGGCGLASTMMELKLKDFLTILLNNSICISATYAGEKG